jgi:hypothetical protein
VTRLLRGQIDEPTGKRARNEAATWEGSSTRGKVVVPGERKSARVSAREASEGYDDGSNGSALSRGPLTPGGPGAVDTTLNPVNGADTAAREPGESERAASPKRKAKGMKGWAWVEEEEEVRPDASGEQAAVTGQESAAGAREVQGKPERGELEGADQANGANGHGATASNGPLASDAAELVMSE